MNFHGFSHFPRSTEFLKRTTNVCIDFSSWIILEYFEVFVEISIIVSFCEIKNWQLVHLENMIYSSDNDYEII